MRMILSEIYYDICDCVNQKVNDIGWNILYSNANDFLLNILTQITNETIRNIIYPNANDFSRNTEAWKAN